jgi:hypothetical protein
LEEAMTGEEEELRERSALHPEDLCPACLLMRAMKERRTRYSGFFDHLYSAQIEMLKAFRALVDAKIAAVEGRKAEEDVVKKVTRIEVD